MRCIIHQVKGDSIIGGKSQPEAPDYSQLAGASKESAEIMARLGQQQLDFSKQQYQDMLPFMTGIAGDQRAMMKQQMDQATVQGLAARGHVMEVINDNYQDFGAGQFIWRAGDPKVEGYVAASDARRDGQAVGY